MKPRRNNASKNPAATSAKANTWVPTGGRAWLFGAGLLLVTLAAYWPALHGGFLWDDETHVEGNLNLRSAHGLWNIWFKPGDATSQYLQFYPLTFTVFWLEYHLWGLNTLGYHVVNVLLHGTVAILLWQVLQRLKMRGAWLAGAIFALHPVCVMSVAWMTELKNTLSASLALVAAWSYLRATGLGGYSREKGELKLDWRFYVLSLVLFQLALFAKTAVSFLPVTLLLVMWWCGRRVNSRSILPVLPMFGQAVLIGLLTIYVEKHSGGASGQRFDVSYADRILISGRSFWFYLEKLFFPHDLTFFYERWPVNPGVWWQDVFPLATIGLLAAAWLFRAKIGRGPFTALAHFYVSTSLLILLVVLYMTRYTFVSDHWQYFGCMSVIAMAAAGIVWALDRFAGPALPLKMAVCGILLAGLAGLTWRQCGMYTDIKTLWEVTLERNPTCSVALNDLGSLLLREAQGLPADQKAAQIKTAREHFEKVLAANPDDAVANYNLGSILQVSQPAEALGYYERSLQANQDDADAQENLGNLLVQLGRIDDALPHLQRAVELQLNNANTHYNLATALMQKGRLSDAVVEFKLDLALNPADAMGHANYGSALMAGQQTNEGLNEFRKAVELMPNSAAAHAFFGNALLQTAELTMAVGEFQKALKIQPDFPPARSRLLLIDWIWATHPDNGFRNGILALRLATDLQKDSTGKDPAVLRELAAADAEMGYYSDAADVAGQALQIATTQSNTNLAADLRGQLEFYRSGRPFRDATLTNLNLSR